MYNALCSASLGKRSSLVCHLCVRVSADLQANDLSGLPLTDIKMSTDQSLLRGVSDQNVSVPASNPVYSHMHAHMDI